MRTLLVGLFTAWSAAIVTSQLALADDWTKGRKGTRVPDLAAVGTPPRAGVVKSRPEASDTPDRKSESREKLSGAFTLVGRTRDGKEVRKAPPDDVVRTILGDSGAPGAGKGPSMQADGSARVIVGKDKRVHVTKTDEYPYSAIGLLYYQSPGDDKLYGCTGAMVGPRTLVTTASCLYTHQFDGDKEDGEWNDKFVFYPGLNGDQGLGSFEYDTAYVFEGWLTEYDGSWGSVEPYDIGIITFSEDVSEQTGYLGQWNFGDDSVDFTVNAVDYPNDKSPNTTMWASTCTLAKKDVNDFSFLHDCDVDSLEAAQLYVYDSNEDSYYLIGIQHAITQNGKRNAAIRLYGPVYKWIDTLDD
jgi:V8-like Glu-specific endopeptidase